MSWADKVHAFWQGSAASLNCQWPHRRWLFDSLGNSTFKDVWLGFSGITQVVPTSPYHFTAPVLHTFQASVPIT